MVPSAAAADAGVPRRAQDIVEGNFKGFAMLRQMTLNQSDKLLPGWDPVSKPQPVYIQVRRAAGGWLLPVPLVAVSCSVQLPTPTTHLLRTPVRLAGLRLRPSLPGGLPRPGRQAHEQSYGRLCSSTFARIIRYPEPRRGTCKALPCQPGLVVSSLEPNDLKPSKGLGCWVAWAGSGMRSRVGGREVVNGTPGGCDLLQCTNLT